MGTSAMEARAPPLRTAAVEPLDHSARLVVAAEIDCCVLRLDGM